MTSLLKRIKGKKILDFIFEGVCFDRGGVVVEITTKAVVIT